MWYATLPRACLKSLFNSFSFFLETRYSKGSNIASRTASTSASSGYMQRQLLLEHQRAGRNRREDGIAIAGVPRKDRDILLFQGIDPVQVAELELGHAAADFLVDQHVRNLVMGEQGEQVVAELRLVVVHVAGGEDRHLAGGFLPVPHGKGRTLLEGRSELARRVGRQLPVLVHAQDALQHLSGGPSSC